MKANDESSVDTARKALISADVDLTARREELRLHQEAGGKILGGPFNAYVASNVAYLKALKDYKAARKAEGLL